MGTTAAGCPAHKHRHPSCKQLLACLCPCASFLAYAVNTKVRIHSITIKGPSDGSGPKLVKLYTNRISLGFSDADSVPCAEQLDLTPKQLEGHPIPLKLTKVSSPCLLAAFLGSLGACRDWGHVSNITVVKPCDCPSQCVWQWHLPCGRVVRSYSSAEPCLPL